MMLAKHFLLPLSFIASALAQGVGVVGPIPDGVNCDGSSDAGFIAVPGISTPFQQVGFVLNLIQDIDPNRLYQNGEHIGCAKGTIALFVPISLCFFLQKTSGGVLGGDVLKLATQLSLSCGQMGSISTGFFNGDLNVNDGELTFNAVLDNSCGTGLCN